MNQLIQILDILTEEEVNELNTYIDTLEFTPCTIMSEENFDSVDSNIRSSNGASLDDSHPITLKFHTKINEALYEYKNRLMKINHLFNDYPMPGGRGTTCWRESIGIIDYELNQHYNYHHDQSDFKNDSEFHRVVSVIVYLTNDFEGGRTLFPHESYKPKVGQGLIFPSNWCYPHSGEKVTSGKKRVAVTWYYTEYEV